MVENRTHTLLYHIRPNRCIGLLYTRTRACNHTQHNHEQFDSEHHRKQLRRAQDTVLNKLC